MIWRRLGGSVAGLFGAILWSPIVMFLVWLPRLSYPDILAYGMAALFTVGLAALGYQRPAWGLRMLAVAFISWLGLALLLALEVLEVA
ncbi:MAG: hypothetical protein ACYDCL_22815 [Myxococcales bacterium]